MTAALPAAVQLGPLDALAYVKVQKYPSRSFTVVKNSLHGDGNFGCRWLLIQVTSSFTFAKTT